VELTNEQIEKLLKRHLRAILDTVEADRIMSVSPMSEADLEHHLEALSYLETKARKELAAGDYRRISRHVDVLLKENRLIVQKWSETYRALCRELLKTHAEGLQIEQQRLLGFHEPGAQHTFFCGSEAEPEGRLLSEIIDAYVEQQKKARRWTRRTEQDVGSFFRLLLEIIGNPRVNTIDQMMMRNFKEVLLQRSRGTVEHAGNVQTEKSLSMSTGNKVLRRTALLFKWAMKNGYMRHNPAEGLLTQPKNK